MATWDEETTKKFIDRCSEQVEIALKNAESETDFNDRMKFYDEAIMMCNLMAKADTAHKNYLLKKFERLLNDLLKKLGIAF